ncbi:MAG: IS110 family transposase [Hyphomonadaceae bacterium]|nr:IS110 family transposase [Hyphomonadaceae bacterium]
MHQNILGVDVAKDWIDVCDPASGRMRHIETAPRALKRFAADLAPGTLVVLEASGGYERPLMEALEAPGIRDRGVAYARVNPRQAREFARATGRLAKTDNVDAAMLAEMGRALDLRPAAPADPARRRLAALVARREDLAQMITAESNRLACAREAFVRADIRSLLAVLKRRKLRLETEIEAHKRRHAELDALDRRLRTAPGVGPAVASVLLACMPELGQTDRRGAACLGGLAPHASDSGHSKGKRCIWGGRAEVRRSLYLAAFIASRCDPELRAFRKRLQDRGKPFKVAIIATARKLLTILNAMIRERRDYQSRIPA